MFTNWMRFFIFLSSDSSCFFLLLYLIICLNFNKMSNHTWTMQFEHFTLFFPFLLLPNFSENLKKKKKDRGLWLTHNLTRWPCSCVSDYLHLRWMKEPTEQTDKRFFFCRYLFFKNDWDLGVSWHVSALTWPPPIPPTPTPRQLFLMQLWGSKVILLV